MAKKYDVRLNIYLDKSEPKDKILIEFLEKKYSEVGFIKETMYALATGEAIQSNKSELLLEQEVAADQEFEPVKDAENIDL